MLANNNRKVIRRMAGRSVRNNLRRNLIMTAAVVLASFMLFCIFTVGVTWIKLYRLQNIRLNGGDYDAVLYGVTEEQREKCESDPAIRQTGTVGIAGYISATENDDTMEAGCVWADEAYWNEIMAPARVSVEGTYPVDENEVMVTREGLERSGLAGFGVGDSFSAQYVDAAGNTLTKQFTISGIWDGFGEKSAFYVSEAFYRESGFQIADAASGRYYLDFKQTVITPGQQAAYEESLDLGKKQVLFFNSDAEYSLPVFLGLCGLALITCLCAYLLIYNIMYLSVSQNVRYFGLLQTIGMTQRQIRMLIRGQMLLTGGSGIAAGILLGSAVSFQLLPYIIRLMGIRTGTVGEIRITFQPAVFLLSIAVAALTIWAGSRKPIRLAEKVSPLEAVSYRPACGRDGWHRTGRGRLLWRMAVGQITKDKKKSAVIMVSLAAGLSVFLCMTTLADSQGARTIVTNHMDADLVLRNDTLDKEDPAEWKQIMDEEFLKELTDTDGVQEIYPFYTAEIMVPWDPDFMELWMEEFYAKWMNIPYEEAAEEYREHPENFPTSIVGISENEVEYLQETLDESSVPFDKEAFLRGETCVLHRNDLDLTPEDAAGKSVTCVAFRTMDSAEGSQPPDNPASADAGSIYGNMTGGEKSRKFEIAGMTNEGYYYTGTTQGITPTVIVIDTAVKEFAADPFVEKTGVRYEADAAVPAENHVMDLIQASPDTSDFSWESKLDSMRDAERVQGNLSLVSTGIALLLAVIGILNYINTVLGNVQNRQMELAVLESVGMTDRQRNFLLILEGFCYGAGSLVLTGTVGLAVTYLIYQSMNYMQAPFMVPAGPVVGMTAVTLAVCIAIPVAAGAGMIRRRSVIERIRGIG